MIRTTAHTDAQQVVSAHLPTRWGEFEALGFRRINSNGRVETALAIVLGDLTNGVPLVRVRSQCFTSEVLGSLRCDCNDQLEMAMQSIASEGRGVVIYEHQEGRGIGLMAKLEAYALQDTGLDTVDANHALGFRADYRDFGLPVAILHELGISRARLLSNNPRKVEALFSAGIEVVDRIPCEAPHNPHAMPYLRAKQQRMGHMLNLEPAAETRQVKPTTVDEPSAFSSIDAALAELRAGRMIVVADDEDRENEADLVMAADMVTAESINFMATHGRGLICLAMTGNRLDELSLPAMVPHNTALHHTAFSVSIDANGHGVTTGISAHDRAYTIKAAIDPTSTPDDFARPGHVFPLRARPGGVLERRGQTEAAVDLASLAGLYPAGVICEIINDDGTMARGEELIKFCRRHDLLMITVAELARYRFDFDFDEFLAATEGLDPLLSIQQ